MGASWAINCHHKMTFKEKVKVNVIDKDYWELGHEGLVQQLKTTFKTWISYFKAFWKRISENQVVLPIK